MPSQRRRRGGRARHRVRRSAATSTFECRAGLPDRGAGQRDRLTACGRRCSPCLVSALAYNFFFLPPLYTFTIADPENVVALFFFVLVAVIASNLTARVRAQAVGGAAARQDDRGALSASAASSRASVDAGRSAVGDGLSDRVDAEGARRAAAAGGRNGRRCAPAIRRRTCWTRPIWPRPNGPGSTTRPAGRGADTLPGAKRLFLPMRTGRGAVGVVGLDSDRPGPLLDARPAAAVRCLVRSGGAGDRADQSGAGSGPRPRHAPRPKGCAPRC